MSRSILVIAAHPDDETLGAGGTLARHSRAGDRVHVLFLADGVGARGGDRDAALAKRKDAAQAACDLLGAEAPRFLDLPDNRLDSLPLLDIVRSAEDVVRELQPAIIYTHHGGDLNVDHRIAHQAALTASRPLPGASVEAIYGFEVPSSTEWATPEAGSAFRPQRFVGIDLDLKLRALACYDGEMRAFPHPRSADAVSALARWRGASAGLPAAEAFSVIREVVR